MNLQKRLLMNNACFKAGKTITPKGIMVHSTGANNPNLKRYVGPDDGLLGMNPYNNHWNQYKPGGRSVCTHGFIGKLADGNIATYQTLPWNHRGWHAGGTANDTHIGFEICEDDLTDAAYFLAVYKEAVELCVHLCKQFGLTEKDVICHSEGAKKGIASNHADVMHWFTKHGKSMDTFRAEVKAVLESETQSFEIGDVVAIKQSATRYYPGGPTIPDWVKESYHKVTGVLYAGKEVVRSEKPCVLLGKKINKKTGEETAGILTWTAVDELNLVESDDDKTGDGKYFRVQVGAFSKRENAENLVKELKKAGFKSYITYE